MNVSSAEYKYPASITGSSPDLNKGPKNGAGVKGGCLSVAKVITDTSISQTNRSYLYDRPRFYLENSTDSNLLAVALIPPSSWVSKPYRALLDSFGTTPLRFLIDERQIINYNAPATRRGVSPSIHFNQT
jgi:hypothetical protein